jgi:hypothetical protein
MLGFEHITTDIDQGIDNTLGPLADTSPYVWQNPGTNGPDSTYPGDDVLGFISPGKY